MAALTADTVRKTEDEHTKIIGYGPVATGVTLYEGAIIAFNASGFLAPAADTANFRIAGICRKQVVNAGADGAVTAEFEHGHVVLLNASAAITQADVGQNAVMLDSDSVQDVAAATNDIIVGKIVRLESSGASCWVHVGRPA